MSLLKAKYKRACAFLKDRSRRLFVLFQPSGRSQNTSGWESITVDPATADINKDGEVNLLDSVILSRYLAGWANYETYFTS